MKSLGRIAYSAAVPGGGWDCCVILSSVKVGEQGGGGREGLSNFFFSFSKSAPPASGGSHVRRASLTLFTHGSGGWKWDHQSSGSEAVLRLLVVALRHRSSPHHVGELGNCSLATQPPCHQRTHHHAHLSFFNLQCRNGSPYLISNS